MSTDHRKPRPGMQLGGRHSPLVRERIQVGVILNRLQKHVRGELEMTATQVRAAEIVLKKALPDLSAVEHSGAVEHRNVRELSDAELLAICASSSAGAARAEESEDEPRVVRPVFDA